MADFDIAEAAFAGPRLLGRAPVAALVWGLIFVVMVALVTAPFAGPLVALVQAIAAAGGRPLPPEQTLGLFGGVAGMVVLLALGALVVGSVISCAIYRAVLTPEDRRFAYLRLGPEELWVMLVGAARFLVMVGLQVAMSIPTLIIVGLVATVAQPALAGVRIVLQFAAYGVVVWVTLRLSMAGPMTFTERRFRLFESWTLTRGYGWRLVAIFLLMGVMTLAVYLLCVVGGAVFGVMLWQSMPHPADIQAFLAQPVSQWSRELAPLLTLMAVVVTILGALLAPISTAPWPHILRRLRPGADVAATFS